MKQRPHQKTSAGSATTSAAIALRLQRLWLVLLAALLVATPLLPSEAAVAKGTGVVLVMLWLLMFVAWCTAKVLRQDHALHVAATTTTFGILVLLIAISALVMHSHGEARPSINSVWQWISFAVAFFLCREVLRTDVSQRAMIAVILALAVCLSAHGYYQSFYSLPQTRRDYEANPTAALAEAGLVAPPGSPARSQFENRLYSTEPLATFTLTNSLAGFLSPCLLMAIGITWTSWRDTTLRWRVVPGLIFCIVCIAGCWMLTKSRTAVLATMFGLGLLALYARRTGWRPDWRVVAGGVAAPILLVFFGMIVGGLDVLVLTESAKSLQYRVEYWQATAAMIVDYPWFGCGPGHFQQYYTAYKLPAASETIRDPHNFLLEVWATAGTTAAAAMLALLVVFAFQVRKGLVTTEGASNRDPLPSTERRGAVAGAKPTTASPFDGGGADAWFVYLGAAVGLLIAYFPCGFLVGYMPDLALLPIAAPLGTLVLFALHVWVRQGALSLPTLLCAVVVLLVNLLAAGGITFAGVSMLLWLLMAVSLNRVERQQPARSRPSPTAWGLAIAAWLLLVVCHQTAYDPILRSGALLAEANFARQMGQLDHADATLQRAAAADPYAADPWLQLAALRHERWIRGSHHSAASPAVRAAFDEAVKETLRRDPRSSNVQLQLGHWQLMAYRFNNQAEHLQATIGAYGRAVDFYPNSNLGRAHLAWASFLADDRDDARSEVEAALDLDRRNPHREQKLALQAISDPGPRSFSNQPPGPPENAEQAMLLLRTQLGNSTPNP